MKVDFTYNKDKDVWCLLKKGKSSHNSQKPTRQYEQLIEKCGENPSLEATAAFIDEYIAENQIDIQKRIADFQKEWEAVSEEFQKRAEMIFSVSLPYDVVAYLTINSRCPYSIPENFFYLSLQSNQSRWTMMHELWHFYTWYGLGTGEEEKIGIQMYNDVKEALTVLLNVECKDLLPEGVDDTGYPQHQEMRQRILTYWEKDKNIRNLWNSLVCKG